MTMGTAAIGTENENANPAITSGICADKLMYYIKNKQVDMVAALLSNPTIKAICGSADWALILNRPINQDGDTLLIWASFNGFEAVVDALLPHAELNLLAQDKFGFDAKTIAQHSTHVSIAQKLHAAMRSIDSTSAQLSFEGEDEKDNFDLWLDGHKKQAPAKLSRFTVIPKRAA